MRIQSIETYEELEEIFKHENILKYDDRKCNYPEAFIEMVFIDLIDNEDKKIELVEYKSKTIQANIPFSNFLNMKIMDTIKDHFLNNHVELSPEEHSRILHLLRKDFKEITVDKTEYIPITIYDCSKVVLNLLKEFSKKIEVDNE